MEFSRPIRILQVIGSLDRGGIETWLMHVLRHIDRARVELDFVVHTRRAGAYDAEARALGARIFTCAHAKQPVRYARAFRQILREHGPYDVVHSHVHHFTGYVLRLARRHGVPSRIAHSHLDTAELDARAGVRRKGYLRLMRRWIDASATHCLGVSDVAGRALFGSTWQRDSRCGIVRCGIELQSFEAPVDRATVRASLGLPADAFVVGHVGRFSPQKNHAFLVEVAAALAMRCPQFRLLLVGDGELAPAVRQQVAEMGLCDRVRFTGPRGDIARLLRGAIDVFLLPSLHEGLPLVVLEAQAAGVPALISDAVTDEVVVVPELVRQLSLRQLVGDWADAALALRAPRGVTPAEALIAVKQSSFNIHNALRDLLGIYQRRTEECNVRAVAG